MIGDKMNIFNYDSKVKKVISQREYSYFAIPFILSTLTQPMLGVVDTAMAGRLQDPVHIAGVSLATVIFNTLYWILGFLRVSTTAFSAQAQTDEGKSLALFRPLFLAIFIGLMFILTKSYIFEASMSMMNPEIAVINSANDYYKILIWGAPLVLSNYVMLGWLMGRGKVKYSVSMQIFGNLVNMILDLVFVISFNWGVEGIAFATLISKALTFALAIILIKKQKCKLIPLKKIFDKSSMGSGMRTNLDLMLRTLCLLIQINIFAATGAKFGTIILSANAIILQIQGIISYMFDGVANASSVYSGRAVAQNNLLLLKAVWLRTFQWIMGLIAGVTIIYMMINPYVFLIFTNHSAVLESVNEYSIWLILFPALSGIGLSTYGIFTGMTLTGPVRNSTFFALILFLVILKIFVPIMGNHGLWMGLISFYFGRSIFLILYYKKTLLKIIIARRD